MSGFETLKWQMRRRLDGTRMGIKRRVEMISVSSRSAALHLVGIGTPPNATPCFSPAARAHS
jgi:hypothetical protein